MQRAVPPPDAKFNSGPEPVGPTVKFHIGTAGRCGFWQPSAAFTSVPGGGVLPSVGQAQPYQGSAGGATGESEIQQQREAVAGCAPGRFLIASGEIGRAHV